MPQWKVRAVTYDYRPEGRGVAYVTVYVDAPTQDAALEYGRRELGERAFGAQLEAHEVPEK